MWEMWGTALPPGEGSSETKSLTETERIIAALVAEGLTNAQIAERIFISDRTVQWHLTNIYRKLRISSRTQLVRLVLAWSDNSTP